MKKINTLAIVICSALILVSCSSIDQVSKIVLDYMNFEGVEEEFGDVENTEEREYFTEQVEETEVIEEQAEQYESEGLILDGEETSVCQFYDEYMDEPLEFNDYDDYYQLICFMLLNNIELYEFTVYNPPYKVTEVQGIIGDEMVKAYDDATLVLNTFTDVWSHFEVASIQTYDEQDNITDVTYSFSLANKNGLSNETVREGIEEGERLSEELIAEMYADGRLAITMTDEEKAYELYKWCGENLTYQFLEQTADESAEMEMLHDNFYQAIMTKTAVCQGITGLYTHLCRLVDVPMYVQLGYTNGVPHSWCKLEVDGEWLYIDPTFAITDTNEDGTYSEEWFMVTQEFMETYPYNERVFEKGLLE